MLSTASATGVHTSTCPSVCLSISTAFSRPVMGPSLSQTSDTLPTTCPHPRRAALPSTKSRRRLRMSSWRFSSFLKVSGQHTLGGRFAVTPADPRGGLGRCLWRCSGGSAPPTDPAAVPGRRGRGPGIGSRGEGQSRGGGAGSRASDAPSHQHLPSFCSALCSRHRCGRPCLPLKGTWNFF